VVKLKTRNYRPSLQHATTMGLWKLNNQRWHGSRRKFLRPVWNLLLYTSHHSQILLAGFATAAETICFQQSMPPPRVCGNSTVSDGMKDGPPEPFAVHFSHQSQILLAGLAAARQERHHRSTACCRTALRHQNTSSFTAHPAQPSEPRSTKVSPNRHQACQQSWHS